MTTNHPELKACFYCTGTAERYGAKLHHGIQCINCGVQVSMTGSCAREEIVYLWNSIPRPSPIIPEDAVQNVTDDALREAVERVQDSVQIDNAYTVDAGYVDLIITHALKAQEKPVEVTVKEFNDLIDPQMPSFNNIGNLLLNRFPNGIKLIEGGA